MRIDSKVSLSSWSIEIDRSSNELIEEVSVLSHDAGLVCIAHSISDESARLIAASTDMAQALLDLINWQDEIKHAVPLSYLRRARSALRKAGVI